MAWWMKLLERLKLRERLKQLERLKLREHLKRLERLKLREHLKLLERLKLPERFWMRRDVIVAGSAVGIIVLLTVSISSVILLRAPRTPPKLGAHPTAAPDRDDFTATPTSGGAPLVVHFTANTSPGVTAWFWSFGDGSTAAAPNPTHTYTGSGAYTVSLQVKTPAGSQTVRKAGYISVGPAQPAPQWVTIVDDQFNTPGLPPHWTVYSGSFGDGVHNCASPSLVQVPGDGYLHLKMAYLTSGNCGRGWYTSGIQVARQYGGVDQAITIRFRVVPPADSAIVRSQRALPMRWVDDPAYQWYQGESDYCEGSYLTHCYTFLHYRSASNSPYQVQHEYSINLTQWHTWRIETVGHNVTVYIDDMSKPVWVYNGPAYTTPLSSKRTVLQQECSFSGCPPASYAGETLDVQVDWIIIQNYKPS